MSSLQHRWSSHMLRVAAIVMLLLILGVSGSRAQIHIVAVRPDVAAPGMNVVLDLIGPAKQQGIFGNDGLEPVGTRCELINPLDSLRITLGPVIVSWRGRLVQVPVILANDAAPGPVLLRIVSFSGISDTCRFNIVNPQHLGLLTGQVTIGEGSSGALSNGNVLVVDSLIATNASISFSRSSDPKDSTNPRLQPITILSKGPVRISNSTVTVSADSIDGGPGGGGGGHGHSGFGGLGFTGGGSSDSMAGRNVGSGSRAADTSGGFTLTGIAGGKSENSDQGGGGGTGCLFGRSGSAGVGNDTSHAGGFGGGSGGGELSAVQAFGGGGGGFGTSGGQGAGIGQNQGLENGGRFLIPFAGGSGGGAGNALEDRVGGSGGGGGGAIALVTYDSLVLDHADIMARGDSGSTGDALGAGGGGGSGGGIYLASTLAHISNSRFDASGGSSGHRSSKGGAGGIGGLGRIRLDAATDNCIGCQTTGAIAMGLSLTNNLLRSKAPLIQISGSDPDTLNLSDTVRIYYRSRHTGWQHVDTVRSIVQGHGVWSKWIDVGHDSLYYVVVLGQVNQPSTTFGNQEPDWIVSHASINTVQHRPTPFLVARDSLNIGIVRVSHCIDAIIEVANHGDSVLIIDSASLGNHKEFSIQTSLPVRVRPYDSVALILQFCPDSAAKFASAFTLYSNDTLKRIALTGLGSARHDSVVILSKLVDFGPVKVGNCDTVQIHIHNVGTDTALFNAKRFMLGNFELLISPSDSVLAPNASVVLLARFCPSDSGLAHAVFEIDGRRDSIFLSGTGIIQALRVGALIEVGNLCGATAVNDTIVNRGNGVEILSTISLRDGTVLLPSSIPITLQQGARILVSLLLPNRADGVHRDTVIYTFNDTTLRTIIASRVVTPTLTLDSLLDFHFACVNNCDTASYAVANVGIDTIELRNWATTNTVFKLADSILTLKPKQSLTLHIIYCPGKQGAFSDSLAFTASARVTASANACSIVKTMRLRGVGTDSGLSASSVRYSTTVIGNCRTDSVRIENPCGPDVQIQSLFATLPFEVIPGQLPLTVLSRSSRNVYVRFCPQSVGEATSPFLVITSAGDTLHTTVSGFGTMRPVAHAYFHLTSINLTAGTSGTSSLVFDSSDAIGARAVSGVLQFDPQVLDAQSISGELTASGAALPGAVRISGMVPFTARHTVANVTWLGLVGPSSTSTLSFVPDPDTTLSIQSSNGTATVVDCGNLAGHVRAANPFSAIHIWPQPLNSVGKVEFVLGSSGSLVLQIRDWTGRIVREINSGELSAGMHEILVESSGLSSGAYLLEISSQGWVNRQVFLIAK